MTTKIDMEKLKSEGRIIKVQREKGFGFIISNEHKFVKFFFHWTGLTQTTVRFTELEEGMKVKFIPILDSVLDNTEGVNEAENKRTSRGPRAIQIEVIQ